MKATSENILARNIFAAANKKIRNKKICNYINKYFSEKAFYENIDRNSITILYSNNSKFVLELSPSIDNIEKITIQRYKPYDKSLKIIEINYVDDKYIILSETKSKEENDNRKITTKKTIYENNNIIYIKQGYADINKLSNKTTYVINETHVGDNNEAVIKHTKVDKTTHTIYSKTDKFNEKPFNTKDIARKEHFWSTWTIKEEEYKKFVKTIKH